MILKSDHAQLRYCCTRFWKVLKNQVFLRVRTTDCDKYGAFERFLAPLPAAAADGGTGWGRAVSTRALRYTVRTL